MIYQPFPFKFCVRCRQYLPETTKYFARRVSKRTLHSWCRRCHSVYGSQWTKDHPENCKEADRRWYQGHRDVSYARAKQWKKNNPDKIREYQRRDRQKYGEKRKLYIRGWRKSHPDRIRAYWHIRENRKRKVSAGFTDQDWKEALEYFHGVCAYCGNPPQLWDNPRILHQEHFVPVSKGGEYTKENILPACISCNLAKNNRDPYEWIEQHFGKRKAKKIIEQLNAYFEEVRRHD